MSKPNMYCGECPYWLAFGEPETTDEQNEAILAHCKECDFDPEAEERLDKMMRSLVEAGEKIHEARELLRRMLKMLYLYGYDEFHGSDLVKKNIIDAKKFLEDTE